MAIGPAKGNTVPVKSGGVKECNCESRQVLTRRSWGSEKMFVRRSLYMIKWLPEPNGEIKSTGDKHKESRRTNRMQ